MEDDGSLLKINAFLPSFTFLRPIDLKIGPDGVMYLIEWGTNFGGGNTDSKVERIDYLGARPSLLATKAANTITFSWPADAPGYVLEKTTNLSSPNQWNAVSNNVTQQNGRNTVSVPLGGGSEFFRLRR